MEIISRETLWEGNYNKVINKQFISKTGAVFSWECVERKNTGKIVAIFAVDKAKNILLAKQFRLPQETYVVELPAGLTDKKGEGLEECARRELYEETGYKAKEMIFIHGGPFNSGMDNGELAVYYAPDAEYEGGNEGLTDEKEIIQVVKIKLDDLAEFCANKHEEFKVDIKILGTLKLLEYKKLL